MDFQALIIGIGFTACPLLSSPLSRVVFQQSGIEGKVYRISGNRMPSPRHPSGSPSAVGNLPPATGPGVPGIVCVFGLTSDSQVVRQGTSPYCQAVHARLIRQVHTDDKGNFSILLPPGTYSVFTKKGDLFYATRRDEKNHIAPVKVISGEMTRVDCPSESDHKVVY